MQQWGSKVKYSVHHTHGGMTQLIYKNVTLQSCTTMRQQASGTQGCTESEGHIETCQNTMKTVVTFKKPWNPYTISIQGWCLLTCVLLAQVHILWYYTPTQLRMYVCIHLHSCTHTCTALYICTYVYVLKVVCERIRMYEHALTEANELFTAYQGSTQWVTAKWSPSDS